MDIYAINEIAIVAITKNGIEIAKKLKVKFVISHVNGRYICTI